MRVLKRCLQVISGLSIALVAFAALAFDRPFPAEAKSGTLTITAYPNIEVNGKPRNLSGGARIWSTDNLTVVPNALGSATYRVAYTEDMEGAIDRVWLLTDEEIDALPAPTRRITLSK